MTIRKPRGAMTVPLSTRYKVGDKVVLTSEQQDGPAPCVGDTGTVRRIFVASAEDGDGHAFLLFDIEWKNFRKRLPCGSDEIAPIAEASTWRKQQREAERWLRRQLATLDNVTVNWPLNHEDEEGN